MKRSLTPLFVALTTYMYVLFPRKEVAINRLRAPFPILFAILLMPNQVLAGDWIEWPISEGGNGHLYRLTDVIANWADAEAEAQSRGGHLATINDAAENQWVFETFAQEQKLWIGLYQDLEDPDYFEPNGAWKWISGEPLIYTNWISGEPNDNGGEHWAQMKGSNSSWPGQWNDLGPNSMMPGVIEVFLSEPGEDDPPSDPVYYSCEPAGEDNLVVVVHGWNTDFKKDYENFWVPLAEEIGAAINAGGEWRVCAYDWTAYSGSILTGPGVALNNGISQGNALGQEIGLQHYDHVHLIAHSAGSALIAAAAYWIKQLSPETTVHTTFLDAYAGYLLGPWGEYEEFYGGNSFWSDHYFSRERLVCGGTGLFTELRLPRSFNVDVTLVDRDYDPVCLSSHSWPRFFYQNSISLDYGIYGFPLSFEFQGKSWESVIEDYPVGDLHILDLPLGGGEGGEEDLVFQVRVDEPIDFTAVPYVTSGDKTVTVEQDGFTATTQSDPEPAAAWISLLLDLSQPVNFVQFDAEFMSEAGAKGLLTVYFDGVELGFIDEEFAQAGASLYSLQSYADLGPGVHSLGFRLDPFADVASTVSVMNVATGYGAFVPLGDLNVDGVVGAADLLILLANWGPCGDCDDCPADLDGNCTVGASDLLILLANWG